MPLYEVTYLLRPFLRKAEIASTMRETAKVVMDNGGVVRRISNEGICRVSHPIGNERAARYVTMLFDASDPEQVRRLLATNNQVLRHIVLLRSNGLAPPPPEVTSSVLLNT
eukprot:TRINITY_DN4646_c0_g1_i1.p1 TRINITY_DN4646_c0_g1~~TRINITY_DN4646_c0_g1_i1.p1  ORF type:complete len:111 (+),score=20.73 TRINITY_DN4646_c0_g1_i1:228-560(+)